jgi:predicted alpha/beta superfamily hydrolase
VAISVIYPHPRRETFAGDMRKFANFLFPDLNPRPMSRIIASAGLMLLIAAANAQMPTFQSKPIEQHFPSSQVGMTYKLLITLPPGYEQEQRSYPVLYYLDAWMLGGVMHDSHRIAGLLQAIEPVILVGISLDGDPSAFFYARSRDYTPTRVSPEKLGPDAAAWVPTSGGGKEFLNFLKLELIPHIEANYRADSSDRGLLGYSLGGLFAAWVAYKEPSLFKRYGICSPSLYWDDAMVVRLWENLPNLAPGSVVVFSYTGEEDARVKTAVDTLVSLASAKSGVTIKKFEVGGEGHHTGVVATHMRALLLLYEKER